METLKKIWKILDGNKSIICSTIPLIIEKLIELDILNRTKFWIFIIWVFTALLPPSIYHHIKKGYLKKDKGN